METSTLRAKCMGNFLLQRDLTTSGQAPRYATATQEIFRSSVVQLQVLEATNNC